MSLNPLEPPTRRPKRSTKPLFHVATKLARDDLKKELAAFLAHYREASAVLRCGKRIAAGDWFPEGCYPPALPFTGAPPPQRPPSPPTRRITVLESGTVERGEIPIVEIPAMHRAIEERTADVGARGQPP